MFHLTPMIFPSSSVSAALNLTVISEGLSSSHAGRDNGSLLKKTNQLLVTNLVLANNCKSLGVLL
jgi:hypothetical protein